MINIQSQVHRQYFMAETIEVTNRKFELSTYSQQLLIQVLYIIDMPTYMNVLNHSCLYPPEQSGNIGDISLTKGMVRKYLKEYCSTELYLQPPLQIFCEFDTTFRYYFEKYNRSRRHSSSRSPSMNGLKRLHALGR